MPFRSFRLLRLLPQNGAESLANLKMGGKTAAEAAKKLKDDV